MKYRKKPVVIEAHQWFKNGDHPDDGPCESVFEPAYEPMSPHEGEVVRYFNRPDLDGNSGCTECGFTFNQHGWIDTLEGGHRVCPGDFIITGVKGERYPCKPDVFAATYDLVEEEVGA